MGIISNFLINTGIYWKFSFAFLPNTHWVEFWNQDALVAGTSSFQVDLVSKPHQMIFFNIQVQCHDDDCHVVIFPNCTVSRQKDGDAFPYWKMLSNKSVYLSKICED